MKKRHAGFALTALAAVLFILPTATRVSAQDQDYDQDPPGRAGRVGFVQGSVSFQPGGEGDWLDAVPNRPLTTGDNLWADRDSRAEVQIGSTSVRLGPESSLTFLGLDNNVTQLRVSVGSVYFRVRQLDPNDSFEVDTPNLAFNVVAPGEYRVDVNENGDQTIATVWRGEGQITGGGSSYRLAEGQQGTFSGTDQLSYDVGGIGRPDDFAQWCLDRNRRQDNVRSAQYVPTDMTGYEDLDEYGDWRNVDGYGMVWSPRGVAGDWAPYRYGHWVYVSPWGWTWVEDEPWGFAPFHYGRWAYAGGGWCWVPGPVAVRPVYSPALVAFVGGGGFSVGVGVGGGVGWFPLGPGEVFVPWYRTSPRYVQNVNVTNTRVTVVQVTNVYNNVTVNKVNNITYVNQRNGRAITVVNHDTFVNSRPVYRNIERVDTRRFATAPVSREVVTNIQPQRQSIVGTARVVRQAPPANVMSRPVVVTRQPVFRNQQVPGVARTAAPPPVRTVRAVPVNQAETLNRGARGQTRGGNPAAGGPAPGGPAPGGPAANRPNNPSNNRPDNRPGTPPNQPGAAGSNRPGPDNRPGTANDNGPANSGRPGRAVPRPGNPNAGPGVPERGEAAPRPSNSNGPGTPNREDDNGARPGAANQPGRGPDNAPRPGKENQPGRPNGRTNDNQPNPGPDRGPDSNSPNRNVPRPSGRPDQSQGPADRGPGAGNGNARPDRSDQGPADRGPGAGNGNARPDRSDQGPADRRPGAGNGNARPDNSPPVAPRASQSVPDSRPNSDDNRPSGPPEGRRQSAPPEPRQPSSPPSGAGNRNGPPSQPEFRPQTQGRPSEAKPSQDRPSHPSRSDDPHGNRNNDNHNDNRDKKGKSH